MENSEVDYVELEGDVKMRIVNPKKLSSGAIQFTLQLLLDGFVLGENSGWRVLKGVVSPPMAKSSKGAWIKIWANSNMIEMAVMKMTANWAEVWPEIKA